MSERRKRGWDRQVPKGVQGQVFAGELGAWLTQELWLLIGEDLVVDVVVSFSLQLEDDTRLLQEVWSGDEDKMGGGWDEIEGQMDERREA